MLDGLCVGHPAWEGTPHISTWPALARLAGIDESGANLGRGRVSGVLRFRPSHPLIWQNHIVVA